MPEIQSSAPASRLGRRRFLGLAGLTAAGIGAPALAGCGGQGTGSGKDRIVIGLVPDLAKLFKKPIAQYNARRTTGKKVVLRTMSSDSGAYFDTMRTQLQAGADDIDVFMADIMWGAQFAPSGWIADLSDRFTPAARKKFLTEGIKLNEFDGKIYAVPWTWDSGLLYYRKDLLESGGFDAPPETWDELQHMAEKVMKDQKVKNGLIFQGADYEGGNQNGVEYIRSSGGDVLSQSGDSVKITLDSAEALRGLSIERSMVTSGVAPEAVATFKEPECEKLFLAGDTVFCRNWIYMYGLLGDTTKTKLERAQVGVAEIPVARRGIDHVCLGGGWSLMVNANSASQDEAWKLVEHLTGDERQKIFAKDGFLPTRPGLYTDPEVTKAQPVFELAKDAIEHTTTPPITSVYSDMSLEMAKHFNSSLRGAEKPEDALEQLQVKLQKIADESQ
ncbi:ABC transporter substrate-binding protein [Streptomyces winkii]|uniref:ABC transporter substrate-binding protein n=1 Tax=Streptomyces winkii TaxID=3051178 RepID=UPI0028D01634|nr:ABC transporter substrate-binding protein [Streptomyces sp. DSM 40971]